MGEGVRGLEWSQRIDAHNLSSGIPALEKITTEDHSDYNTWMDVSRFTKGWTDILATYRRNETQSARSAVHGMHIPNY